MDWKEKTKRERFNGTFHREASIHKDCSEPCAVCQVAYFNICYFECSKVH